MPLRSLVLIGVVLYAATVLACGGGDAAPSASPTPAAPTNTPTPELYGFAYPLAGACLPQSDNLMPNAAREYRGGVHEGVDFYDVDNCTSIAMGTLVLAAKAGTVIRADHDYHDLTQAELDAADARIAAGGANDPQVLDLFRGRQLWIDHGAGVVTRYAHLSAIAEALVAGANVEQGVVVGFVGDSGTPESISSPGQEAHLHWEVRVGDTFLGAGLDAATVRARYVALFEPGP